MSVYIDNSSSDKVYFDEFIIERTEAAVAVVVQENHYYPFGMNMKGIEELDLQSLGNTDEYRWQFNGVEKNESFGLNWNETFYRTYDMQLGRWNSLDTLAEQFASWSSYHGMGNNPILIADPYGDDWYMSESGGTFWRDENSATVYNQDTEETYHNIGQYFVQNVDGELFLYKQNEIVFSVNINDTEAIAENEDFFSSQDEFTDPTPPYAIYETKREYKKNIIGSVNTPLPYFGITTAQPAETRYPNGSIERRDFSPILRNITNGSFGSFNSKTIARGAEQALISLNSPLLHVSLATNIDNLVNSTSPARVKVYYTRLTVGMAYLSVKRPLWAIQYRR